MLHRSSDVQSSQGKHSTVCSSRVARALDVARSTNKSPSVGINNFRKPRKASGLKGATKPSEGPSSRNNNVDVNSL